MSSSAVLTLAGVHAGYAGGPLVLRDVSLGLGAGQIVGIVGVSGGGKSTLLSTLVGRTENGLEVREGTVTYRGHDVTRMSERSWQHLRGTEIATVFQRPEASFDPLVRVGDQFVESVRLHSSHVSRSAIRAHARGLLHRLRFEQPDAVLDSYPFELSGGMAQRAAIAMALLSEPRVLLADEPTSALDVRSQLEVLELLRETAERFGTGVLFVSHQISLVEKLCERVHVLDGGRLVESGPTAAVLAAPQHPSTCALCAAVPRLRRNRAA